MAEDSPTSSDAAPALTPFAARLARISNRPRSASSGAPSTSTPASLGSWRSRLVRPAPESPINESPAYATADDDAAAPTFPAVAAPAPGKEEAPRPVAAPITRPAASATAKPRASRATRPLPSLAARAAVSVPAPLTEPAPLAEPAALARPVVLAEPATADEAEPHLNATPSHDAPSPEAAPNDECSAEGDEPKDGDEPKKDPGVLNWGFIIPRVAAVAGVALLLTIFAGSIVAFGLQAVGERIVRAKVDLGETDASWIDARVELKEVAVANRRRPGKNLFSFTDGVLDFDAFKLLSGQYIIDEAKLSGLRFDTDRDDDGRSDFVRLRDIDIPLPEIDLKDLGLDRLKKALGSFSLKGVAAVQERIEQEVLKTELESLTVLQKAREFWKNEYVAWKARAQSVKDRVEAVRRIIVTAKQGAVADRFLAYQKGARDLVELLEEIQAAQVRIAELPGFVKRDLLAVAEAAQRDAAKIRERLKAPFVEAKGLADKLLGSEMQQRMDHVADGIRFVRGLAAPLEDESLEPPPTYGRTFDFPLDEVLPRFLVRKLEVDGVVDLAGTPTAFRGVIEDLTTCPRKLGRPTRVHLTLDGPAHIELDATIDRTTGKRCDTVRVVASKIKAPSRTLGDPDDFCVAISGGEATLELDVTLHEETLDARCVWKQSACRLALGLGAVGDRPWANDLCPREMSDATFTATITATGPLANPEWNLATNLGEALHPHLQGMFDSRTAQVRDHVCGQIEALAKAQLQALEDSLESERKEMLEQLLGGSGVIAEFRDSAAREFPQLQLASLEKLKTAGVDFAQLKAIELQQQAAGAVQQQAASVWQNARLPGDVKLPTSLPNGAVLPAGVSLPAGVNLPRAMNAVPLPTPTINHNPIGANPLGIPVSPLPNGFNPAAMYPQPASASNSPNPLTPPNLPLEAKRFFR